MDFKIGDRVRSVHADFPGLRKSELGTIVEFDSWDCPVINWDEYNPSRHDADGLVSEGHGWFVNKSMIALVQECIDFGDLPVAAEDVSKFLFDT